MVLIPALVVEPGCRIAGSLPFRVVGAAITLIITAAHQEFRGRIFGHIMKEALLIQAHLKTMLHYQPFMMIDGPQMFQRFHVCLLIPLSSTDRSGSRTGSADAPG